jgi:HD-GYP domain-containing protein (c-di-GMP phosphodiesterase class II)
VACCDAFDAMTTDRAYRSALSLEDALEEIRRGAGSQFDPVVAEALIVVARREAAAHGSTSAPAARPAPLPA